MRLLVLDNYDSFTYNLVHLIEKVSDIDIDVFRNNEISIDKIDFYDKIVLSPGPGLPKDAGIMPDILKKYHSTKSIFGVCLGMQAIGEFYGGTLKNLNEVCHGQALPTITSTDNLFNNCPPAFLVGRYHSWIIDKTTLKQDIKIIALDEKENPMAIRHCKDDVCGVQFHPESILSEFGEQIIKNWLKE